MSENPPPAAPADRTDHEILAPLAARLSIDVSALPLLPPTFLEETVSDLRAGPAETARIYIAVARLRSAPPAEDSTLRNYFSQREAREAEPWRRAARAAEVQIEGFARAFAEQGCWDTLRAEFLEGAKGGVFSEIEALFLGYLLCAPAGGEDRARFDIASLLVRVPPAGRVAVHNWRVASGMPAARREGHGAAIAAMPWPLFPDRGGFEALNGRLFAQLPLSGGAPRPERPRTDVFARGRPVLKGAGWLHGFGPDGSQTLALETSPLEARLAQLSSEVAAGFAAMGRGRGRGRGQQRQTPAWRQKTDARRRYEGAGEEDDDENTKNE